MDAKKPKVSVVIPIYNAEAFLNQTLFSVTNQTLKDIEIICVDDCSTDKSREILERFAASDPRISCIYHETNKGVGIARKNAILSAKSAYIMFLDADDFLQPNACLELYRAISKENVDILQFGTTVIPAENISPEELEALSKLLSPPETGTRLRSADHCGLVNRCFVEQKFSFTLWNKIYRGDIVRSAVKYYPEERFNIGEDMYLFFLIAFLSQSYTSVTKEYYNYNFGCGITGGKKLTDKGFLDRVKIGKIIGNLESFAAVYDPYEETKPALENLKKDYVSSCIWGILLQDNTIHKAKALSLTLEYFDPADVLAEMLYHYYQFNDSQRKEFWDILQDVDAFQSKPRTVKTIGTFYYRITDGGLERVMALLINIWCKMGYRVVLFTEELPSALDYAYPANVTREIIPKIKGNTREEFRRRTAFWRDMLVRYEVDVMVNQAWTSETIEVDTLAVKSAGIPLVMHTHGLFSFGVSSVAAKWAYSTVAIARSYKLADAVITLSDADYTWWRMHHPCVFKTVNPLTFDLNKVTVSQLNTNSLLYVGRIQQDKRVEDLLEILRLVLDMGCETTLHIVGKCEDPQYENHLTEEIKNLKLENHVKMHGYQSNVGQFYEKASVSLMASAFEGFPMSFVKSMAYGVPIVTYDLPNVDFIHNTDGISIVGQRDVRGAADAVVRLLTDRQLLKTCGQSVREHVQQIYAATPEVLWKRVFQSIESGWQNADEKMDTAIVKKTVSIFLDAYLSGVEAREKERINILRTRGYGAGAGRYPADPGSAVLKMYQDGALGFAYIFRFIKAYIKFKFSKQNRLRKKARRS